MTTPDRWPRIEQLFRETLKQRPEERSVFLAQACDGEAALQEEVQRLLKHHQQAELQAFLKPPAQPLPWLRLNPPGPEDFPTIRFKAARDNASLGEDPLLEAGARIGRYRIEALLGEGGFGRVYRADDEMLRRTVAIKAPHPDRFSRPTDTEDYLKEARVLAMLDHPHIVPVYDVGGAEHNLCFVVSKLIEGSNLKALFESRRPSHNETAELIATVAEALHYAHSRGVVHRDIKPANILLDNKGQPHIADFGLALKEEDFGHGLHFAGSPAYMSPEQARGEGHLVDGRSDIFSLGVVLYESLVGQRPFWAKSIDELLEQIKTVEARPPRQIDDAVPKELERICLKSLSKRATDRYCTARDMAEDLRHFLEAEDALRRDWASGRLPIADSPQAVACRLGVKRSLSPKIIPKGLRSFDENDADFFLELLPGPRDRDGLPESIRFWKTRIEETDSDKTFRIGLIYGPSGCGKSSLVKAGLLPRLAEHVETIYVESTPENTETRLLKSLRKQLPQLPSERGLVETLSTLRRAKTDGGRRKVLLVLDQFEQWLHAHRGEENTELVKALRQCDGEHLQCVVMVRDDFWLAVSRFMSQLEVDLAPSRNMALADLFDLLHARRVLAEFGRAYECLPDDSEEFSPTQQEFLERAVEVLSQEGRVVCVRLALFAEMMKGRMWTPRTLYEVGGAEGVGVTFLEEVFSAATASPKHRLHLRGARGVLKALLPPSGTDIKGNLRSHEELFEASGYARRPKDFNELIRILDSEIRLITPTDPEGVAKEEEEAPAAAQTGGKYYQLTHDYLVPSLREWLTRKQRETRRGRSELRLAERSATWNNKPENRQLPAWWEYLQICALTRTKDWTAPQQKMMQRASRFHAMRAAVLLFLLAMGGWGGYEVNGYVQARRLVDKLASAKEDVIWDTINQLRSYQRWARPRLERMAASDASSPKEKRNRLHARLALVGDDPSHVDSLRDALLEERPSYIGVIRQALRPYQAQLVDDLWETFDNTSESPQRRFAAGLALADYARSSKKGTPQDVRFLTQQLLAANPEHQSRLRELLRPIAPNLLPEIVKSFHNQALPEIQLIAAANAVQDYAGEDAPRVARLLTTATPAQYAILYPPVAGSWDSHVKQILADIIRQQPAKNLKQAQRLALGKQRAGAAIVLLRQGARKEIFSALRVEGDHESLTQFIHRCRDRGVRPKELLDCLQIADSLRRNKTGEAPARENRVLFGLLLALGEFRLSDMPEAKQEPLVKKIAGWYADDPSSAIHGACGWLLRRWGRANEAERVDHTPIPYDPGREWFTLDIKVRTNRFDRPLPEGQKTFFLTFVVFPPGEYEIGSPPDERDRFKRETRHRVRITRPFALLDREITVSEFQAFDPRLPIIKEVTPTPAHALVGPSWYDGVRYCRWLNEQAGLEEKQQAYANPASLLDKDEYPADPAPIAEGAPKNWPLELERTGFRFPTESEWEVACRGGARSVYGFGNDHSLLDRYGWFVENSNKQVHIPRMLRPNLRGLFDLHGNALEWCHDWTDDYPTRTPANPMGPLQGAHRVNRGGSWLNPAAECRAALRNGNPPSNRFGNLGFRVARSLSASPSKQVERRAEAGRSVER